MFSGGSGVDVVNLVFKATDLTKSAFSSLGNNLAIARRNVGAFAKDLGKKPMISPPKKTFFGSKKGTGIRKGTRKRDPGSNKLRTSRKKREEQKQKEQLSATRLAIAQKAVGMAVDGFISAFSKMTSAISDGIDQQQSNVSSALAFSKTLGLTSAQATAFVQDFNLQAAKLGQSLPISARDVSDFAKVIQTDFANAIKSAGGTADQFKTVLLDVSSKIALSAQTANVDQGSARAAVSAYLAGSVGVAGLNQYAFFANNPLLRQGLARGLQQVKPGADSFGDLSAFQRVKLLTDTLNKTITAADIAALQGTSKAKIASVMDNLFDPQIGVFSIQRDLDPKLPGYQSVFSSFEKTLDLLIGDKGVFGEISRLFGGGPDPMAVLKDGVDKFNIFLTSFKDALTNMKALDPGALGGAVGKFAAQVVNVITDGVLAALAAVDYGAVIQGLVAGVGSFLANLDWKVYAVAAVGLLGVVFIPPIIAAVSAIAVGIVAAIGGVPLLIGAAITLGVVAIGKMITDNWDGITKGIKDMFGAIGKAVEDLGDWIKNILPKFTPPADSGPAITGIGQAFGTGYEGSPNLMAAIASESRNMPSGASLVVANSSETILTSDQLSTLLSSRPRGGVTNSNSVIFQPGAITMTLPGGTAQEVAMAAIAIIESALTSSLENSLA